MQRWSNVLRTSKDAQNEIHHILNNKFYEEFGTMSASFFASVCTVSITVNRRLDWWGGRALAGLFGPEPWPRKPQICSYPIEKKYYIKLVRLWEFGFIEFLTYFSLPFNDIFV
jgi:hypothetical protein